MTTDNKTLADVQPGGMVRLGNQALSTSEGARRYVADYFDTQLSRHDFGDYILTELAADFACALAHHLSAQPSPGGQGDELDLDRVLSLADVHAEESREDGVRLLDRGGLLAFAQDVAAALAARQPVRSAPEWFELVIRDVCELDPEDPDAAGTVCIRLLDLRLIMERHALPAQAVDLGQFRDAITREYANSRALCDMPRILECERLLALIDSMAVGNG
ncbi:hypothetical protein D7U76_15635 [Stenotrophomonas maltophilia]|nr:hypothetical protein [Stenotrophomonas maltophilia]